MKYHLFYQCFVFLICILLASSTLASNGDEANKNNHKHHTNMEMKTEDTLPEMSIFQLDSKWTNQEGKTIQLKDLSSQPTIFAMVYTSCGYACPIITSTMLDLEKKMEKIKISNVKFLLISFDPEKDTSKQLKEYAKKRKMNLNKWMLITSDNATVQELAVVLGVNYKKLQNGDIAHSNIIFLMDQSGVIKNKVVGLNKDVDSLIDSINKLNKQ
ncbi:MAG TPA: SCO family protein [Oligoflexia bacterium]|nr:SCO family protein [Oligoflexia bacterium]HMR25822.1 SCO family protein [Oligoflexia bacterium]